MNQIEVRVPETTQVNVKDMEVENDVMNQIVVQVPKAKQINV
jgi:hypothetical protein